MAPPETLVDTSSVAGHPIYNSFVETEYFDKISTYSKPLPVNYDSSSVR
jgi:hypothetical protein